MGVEEKRKSRRIDLESHIVIKRIDNGIEDYVKIGIQDISRTGEVLQVKKIWNWIPSMNLILQFGPKK